MKKLKLYYLFKVTGDTENLITIVYSKKHAMEFAANYLRLEHYNHYKMWCYSHNKELTAGDSWMEYCQTCITPEEAFSFKVTCIKMPAKDIAESLRILCGFSPLGLSYEGPLEFSIFMENFKNIPDESKKEWFLNQCSFSDIMREMVKQCLV